MRFLTYDWWAGSLTDEECELAKAQYRAHFLAIEDRLPTPIVELHENGGLHDGKLLGLRIDAAKKTAHMVVDAWDNFNGDNRITYRLRFEGVEAFDTRASYEYARSAARGYGDLGYIEIDILPCGLFRMDFLFWSAIELGITFRSLSVEASPPPENIEP